MESLAATDAMLKRTTQRKAALQYEKIPNEKPSWIFEETAIEIEKAKQKTGASLKKLLHRL